MFAFKIGKYQNLIISRRESSIQYVLFVYRDSQSAKQVMAVFDQVYKKHASSKKFSVSAQSCSLLADHLMPMMTIEDRGQEEIVCQVFNFIDVMGGLG